MTTKTDNDVIRRNGGPHIALLIMKMYMRPVTLDEFTEISAKKLAVRHRTTYLKRLARYGYATCSEDGTKFQITQKGLDKIIELVIPPDKAPRRRKLDSLDDDD